MRTPWGRSTPDDAERRARELFQRTLARWAMDALALRKHGLDRPVRHAVTAGW